jgi:hypothetical protein
MFLTATAVIAAVLGVGSFALAEKYHVPEEYVIAAGIGLLFIWLVGRRFRSRLRQPSFLMFFLLWLVIHTAGSVLVVFTFNLLIGVEFTMIELAIGCVLAHLLFGQPSGSR